MAGARSLGDFVVLDQSVLATHSANGATARPQVGAVSDSRTANEPIRRQFPLRCSKNHSRLSGPIRIDHDWASQAVSDAWEARSVAVSTNSILNQQVAAIDADQDGVTEEGYDSMVRCE